MAESIAWTGELTAAMQVRDLDRGIAWYHDVLGFEVLYRKDDIGWCELKSPVASATLTFGVRDIATARATLEAQKVRFDGETIEIPGLVKLATFYDVDGNKLMLFETPA